MIIFASNIIGKLITKQSIMKTRILLIIFILSGLFQASAQEQSKKFNFGLKIAPALSWLSTNEKGVSSDGPLFRFNWGAIGAYNFSQNFALVSGININSLGGKLKHDATNVSVKSKYSEFQIPAILQMKSNEIGVLKIHFQIGLAGGIFMSAKDGNDENIYSQTRPFNASYIVASGVDFPVKGGFSLIGQIKYNGGLTNISKSGSNAKSSFIELGLGVLF